MSVCERGRKHVRVQRVRPSGLVCRVGSNDDVGRFEELCEGVVVYRYRREVEEMLLISKHPCMRTQPCTCSGCRTYMYKRVNKAFFIHHRPRQPLISCSHEEQQPGQ